MAGSHFGFSTGRDLPEAVACGRLDGVLREPVGALPEEKSVSVHICRRNMN
jgi:hypothetical protein